jgi:hypothetical protein
MTATINRIRKFLSPAPAIEFGPAPRPPEVQAAFWLTVGMFYGVILASWCFTMAMKVR